MAKTRSVPRIGSWLKLGLLLLALPASPAPVGQATPDPALITVARPPLVLGVAIDEAGISPGDLKRSQELVLALFDQLPPGSKIMLGIFSGDDRIVLAPTADRPLLVESFSRFNAGVGGVALPDGLFDLIGYLASRDADARALLLVSTGRLREGDLQFEDPLNAAVDKNIKIFSLALGQGDGKLLRRIAKITGGEYIRLEVADAIMLARSIVPSANADAEPGREREAATPTPRPEGKPAASLLGAAAVFFSVGGLIMLGIVVLLIRRLAAPASPASPNGPPPPAPPHRGDASPALFPTVVQDGPDPIIHEEDEAALEKTLMVNADPTLRALSGPGAGKNFPLSASGHTTIGRSRRNDIVVPEDAASANHCRIDREGDSYVLHDLGATNGTWVNGVKTERAVLQHGDRMKVGGTVFTVSLFGDRP
jgi:hypothetical protein